jgi:hypothetical protein
MMVVVDRERFAVVLIAVRRKEGAWKAKNRTLFKLFKKASLVFVVVFLLDYYEQCQGAQG